MRAGVRAGVREVKRAVGRSGVHTGEWVDCSFFAFFVGGKNLCFETLVPDRRLRVSGVLLAAKNDRLNNKYNEAVI